MSSQPLIEQPNQVAPWRNLLGSDPYEFRFAAAQAAWLGLILLAVGIAALFDSESLMMAGSAAALAGLPAALGLALTPAIRKEWAAALACAIWIALASAVVASTGGAWSPLSILFFVPLGLARLLGRRDLGKEAGLMAAMAFVVCLVAGMMGVIDTRAPEFNLAYGMGALISLVYVIGLMLTPQVSIVEGRVAADLDPPAVAPRYLAELAHELKTPLNAIIGFADVMRQSVFGKLPDKYAEYVETIHQSGRHMLEVITNMLDMSRIRAGGYSLNPEVIDARVVVTETVQMMREAGREAGVSILAPGLPDPLRCRADKTALKQILTNLIVNGLKYTPPGGQVTVRAEGGSALTLVVADTGVGIPKDALERVMRPFEQGPSAKIGAGLGLAVVRGLAELHGGHVVIDSPPGSGAIVTVTLPVLVKNG